MSKVYYRTPQMATGNGFRCHNCNQELAKKLTGSVYEITLECRRCHAVITVRVKEPIPFAQSSVGAVECDAD